MGFLGCFFALYYNVLRTLHRTPGAAPQAAAPCTTNLTPHLWHIANFCKFWPFWRFFQKNPHFVKKIAKMQKNRTPTERNFGQNRPPGAKGVSRSALRKICTTNLTSRHFFKFSIFSHFGPIFLDFWENPGNLTQNGKKSKIFRHAPWRKILPNVSQISAKSAKNLVCGVRFVVHCSTRQKSNPENPWILYILKRPVARCVQFFALFRFLCCCLQHW